MRLLFLRVHYLGQGARYAVYLLANLEVINTLKKINKPLVDQLVFVGVNFLQSTTNLSSVSQNYPSLPKTLSSPWYTIHNTPNLQCLTMNFSFFNKDQYERGKCDDILVLKYFIKFPFSKFEHKNRKSITLRI